MRVVLAAAVFLVAAIVCLPAPIIGAVLEASLKSPVALSGARWTGFGDWSAESLRIGASDKPRAILAEVRVDDFLPFAFGGVLRLRFERLSVAGENIDRSSARIVRHDGGVIVFADVRSSAGRARGGVFWRGGKPLKISGRVALTPEGMGRVPGAWAKRLTPTADGPAFTAAYAADKIVLRGRGVPIVEAAWQVSG